MWRNQCINDTYEPGSTFKVITAAAALEEGVVSLEDRFHCPGYIVVEDRQNPLSQNDRAWSGKLCGRGLRIPAIPCLSTCGTSDSVPITFMTISSQFGLST